MNYTEHFEKLKETYERSALSLLKKVRQLCVDEGMVASIPADASADDYRWEFAVRPNKDADLHSVVAVVLTLEEQREYEDGEGWGMGWSLTATNWSGEVVAELRPYNYTTDVWVDSRDELEVAARWELIENSNIAQIPRLIKEAQ